MKLLLVTGNQHKAKELQELIPNLGTIDIDLPEIQEIDAIKVIEAKLETAQAHSDENLLVEDTSLYLDCLNGLPGPLIKWFQKTIGNEGIYKIAQQNGNTGATARTVIGLRSQNGELNYFDGEIRGQIVAPRGVSDFGWDPIFQPEGSTKTFAEMNSEEKNTLSMRKIAAAKLQSFLA